MAVNETRRPRVVMMCGPGGAGKTTYAKRLERDGWTRLSFEVEFWERGITTMPSADVVAEVAAELKASLLRQVAAGNDVVLDFGFWFRRQRDEYRALLAPRGIVPETVYLATSLEVILSRVGDRHGRGADDWPLTEQTATEYFERFEPPTAEEGPLEVVSEAV
ncbi:ATP-binding protein [Agromyces endophyticus]|uniref:AAA family ATPase n=1 Tax=Agromyces sp. H17E-10 TaxID=2932244 RepID=UPI001FD03003|nr:ATP-binding protein [Agromyces sp. H17E-10]UOQ90803.1 ATP-binding protein [Agromyces sp. H17E-10]